MHTVLQFKKTFSSCLCMSTTIHTVLQLKKTFQFLPMYEYNYAYSIAVKEDFSVLAYV